MPPDYAPQYGAPPPPPQYGAPAPQYGAPAPQYGAPAPQYGAPPPPPPGYAPPPMQPQYGAPPGYPPQGGYPQYPQGAQNIPQDIQMPAPYYGGATEQALHGGDIEQQLDSDQILNDFHNGNMEKEDIYAQQARMRAQQENQQYQQKIGQLEQQNQALSNDVNYMKGQLETISSSTQQSQQAALDAERAAADQAALKEYELSPEEQRVLNDYGPALEKVVGRALFLQERKLKDEFSSALATHTQEALSPVNEQLSAANTKLELQERSLQNQFDIALNQALSTRGVTLEGLLQTEEFRAYGNHRIEGSDLTRLKIMRDAAQRGDVAKVIEVVDGFLNSRGYNTAAAPQAQVPQMGNTPRMHSPQEAQVLQERQAIANELEQLEYDNSIGNYDRFNGSKKAFLERRNQLLQYLEKTPLPN